jgi:hypothetical protein
VSEEAPENENPEPKDWPTNRKVEAPQIGLFVTDAEIIRRLGVSEKTGYIAIRQLDRSGLGFPQKQKLWGNKRYWPAVRQWFDRQYIPRSLTSGSGYPRPNP